MIKLSKDLTLPLDVAGEAIAILATRGAGKSYTSAVLVEELYRAQVQTVVIDPTGVYWGLRSGKGGGLPIIVLGGVHGDVPLQETAGKLIADLVVDTAQSMVLDLSDFESDGAQCRFMVDFAERLYRRKARARSTLHLVIDEADEFAPQQPQAKEARMVGAMAKLVRRGRSRGIGMTMITQRSAALNKNLLDLVDTLLLMRMLGPRDREAASGWIKHNKLSDELGVLDSLPSLPTGTAWVWSPLRGVLEKVAMRRIETFDSYVTPKPGEVRLEPKALAKVDIEKLGEQIKATAEKAKADDPVALRKRIAELEKQKRPVAGPVGAMYTPAQFAAEYVRGRNEGHDAGVLKGVAIVDEFVEVMQANINVGTKKIVDYWQQRRSRIEATKDIMNVRPPVPEPENTLATAQRLFAPAAAVLLREKRTPSNNGTTLPTGERAILIACAQHDGGCTREQLTVLTGYKRSTRDAYIQRLREKALVAEEFARVMATDDGRAALGPDFKPLPTGKALQDYWLDNLPDGERKVFDEVLSVYPDALDREAISNNTGYKRSTRDAYIQRLISRQLLKAVDRGTVKASENLF